MILPKKITGLHLLILSLCPFISALSQDCNEICDEISFEITTTINEDQCTSIFEASDQEISYDESEYEIEINYNWEVDGDFLGVGQTINPLSTQIFPGDSIELFVWVSLLPINEEEEVSCACSENFVLTDLIEDFETWGCSCQSAGPPIASFYVENEGECGNLGISFVNTVTGGEGPTFDWSFGEDYEFGQSFEASPTVDVIVDGGGITSAPVTLTVVDDSGCVDSVTESVDILQTPNPGDGFEVGNICTGNPNNVNQTIEIIPLPIGDGGIATIISDWGFEITTETPPEGEFLFEIESPFFNDFGNYPYSIDFIGENGCISNYSGSLFIGSNPQVGASNLGNTSNVCAPYLMEFGINGTENNNPSTTYIVDYGDGSEPEIYSHPPPETVTHEYNSSSCGANNNEFQFSVTAVNDCDFTPIYLPNILLHEPPNPEISGVDTVCVSESRTFTSLPTGYFIDGNSCLTENNIWEVYPLQGQALPSPPFGYGSQLTTTFNEPGLYNIHVIEPHEICDNADDTLQVCVYPEFLEPIAQYSPINGCIPLEVELSDITPPLPCGHVNIQWQIEGGNYEWAEGSGPESQNPTVILLDAVNYQIDLIHTPPVTFNNSTCNEGVFSFPIEAYEPPDVEINATDYFLCSGDQIESDTLSFYDGNLDEFEFEWIVNGEPYSNSINSIFVEFETGIHSISAVATNICGADTSNILISVYDNPVITVDSPLSDCIGDTITVLANGAEEYQWQTTNDTVNSTGNTTQIIIGTTSTEYVTGTINYAFTSCSITEAFDVIAFELPVIEITGNNTLCDQEELALSTNVVNGEPEYQINWSEVNSSLDPTSFVSIVDENFNSVVVYIEDANGCTSEDETSIVVNSLPEVEAGFDEQYCDQQILTFLENNDPLGGVWDGVGITNSITGEVDPSQIGVGTSVITYTYTDSNGCVNNDSLIIDVVEPIFSNAGPDVSVCNVDTTITFEGFSPIEGQWSNPEIDQNSIDVSGFAPGVYQYTYEYSEGTCYTEDFMLLEIYERPNIYWNGPSDLCIFEEGYFDITIDGGSPPYNIDWVTTMDQVAVDGLSATNTWDVSGIQTIIITVSDLNDCQNELEVDIMINPLPNVFAGQDTTFCNQNIIGFIEGFTPGLNENGSGYFYGIGEAENAVSNTGEFDPTISGSGFFEVVYSFTNSTTSCTNTDTLQISVIDLVEANAGPDTTVCNNSEHLYLEGYFPDILVSWTSTDGFAQASIIDNEIGIINPLLLEPGSYDYLMEYGVGTCYSSDIVTVNINALPEILLSTTSAVCSNEGEVQITDFTPAGGTWEGEGILDQALGVFDSSIGVGEYDLFYWYEDPVTSCIDTAQQVVTINEIPNVFAGPDIELCDQDITQQLIGNTPQNNDGGIGEFSGLGDAVGAINPSGVYNPIVSGIGQFDVVYTFTSIATGCTNSDTLEITTIPPTLADAGLDTTVCDNAPTLLLEGFTPTTGINWFGLTSEGNGGIINSQIGTINPLQLSPGAHEYIIEYGESTCYHTDTLTVNISPLPTIVVNSEDLFCSNDGEVTFADYSPLNGTWEGTGVVDEEIGVFNTEFGPGVYDLMYMYTDDITQCTDTVNHLVEVQEIPIVFAGNDTTFCNQPILGNILGYSPGLTQNGIGNFYGIGDAEGQVSNDGELNPATLGVGSFEVVYEFTNSTTNCTNRDTITIVISDPVVADAGLDTTVCFNSPVLELEGFTPISLVTWSGIGPEADNAVTNSQLGHINPQLLTPGTFDFQIEHGIGTCYSSDILSITVNPLPNLEIESSDIYCSNDDIVALSNAIPLGGNWEGLGIEDSNTGLFDTGIGPGDWDVFYWYTDPSTNCSDTITHQVTIQDIPEVFAGLDTTYCNQSIEAEILGYSPTFNDNGTGFYFGLEDAFSLIDDEGGLLPTDLGVGSYEAVYSFTNSTTGCTNTDTTTITISNPVIADAGIDTVVCYNSPTLQLEGYSPSFGVTWSAIDGDATSSLLDSELGQINPQLLEPGDYDFLIENGIGTCYTSDVLTVTVDPLPQLSISNSDQFCGNLWEEELITPEPQGGFWFGDNIMDEQVGTINTNIPQGVYEVYYSYQDPQTLCSDTISHSVEIMPVPQAQFSADVLGCNNLPFPFVQESTGATGVEWNFGNGDISNQLSPNYTYPQIGSYTVTLYASNFWGCIDTTEVEIEITDLPIADFSVSDNYGCAPLNVSFTNTSYAPYSSYEWDLNGQTYTAETPPDQPFIQGDSIVLYDAQLVVSNICGQSEFIEEITALPIPQMSFLLFNDTACSPFSAELMYTGSGLPETVLWDYGNGQTSSGEEPISPTYIVDDETTVFDITLTGENECGSTSETIPIWIQPNSLQSFFSTNVTNGCPPLELVVTNNTTGITDVTFDFGDGNFSSEEQASNTYYDEGDYTVTQYVTNGCSYDTSEVIVTVHPEPEFQLLSDDTSFCEGEEASFSADVASPGSINWEFGDGEIDSGMSVNHVFDDSGDYVVEATISSNLWGCLSTESIDILINATPEIDIESSVGFGCSPLTVSFLNETTDTDFWTWNYDDQTPNDIVEDPTHIFENNNLDLQSYNVLLSALNLQGCEASGSLNINVFPAPISEFEISEELLCGIPSTIFLTNNSYGAQTYFWELNNQPVSSELEPTFEANQIGLQQVDLLVTNSFECTSLSTQVIEVFETPIPQVLISPQEGCEPLAILVEDISLGAISTNISIANAGWFVYNGAIIEDQILIENSGNYVLNMTAISPDGCTGNMSDPEIINVWPLPDTDFNAEPSIVSSEDPTQSHPYNTTFEFLNLTTGHQSSYWVFGNGDISHEEEPIIDFVNPGQYPVLLATTSQYGCMSTHSEVVIISTQLEVFAPNAFTPSFDGASTPGINDAFRLEFSNLNALESYHLQIFNRWGILVWESFDPEEYWTGEVRQSGQHYTQNEVYTWVAKVQSNTWVDNADDFKGHVIILR